MVRESKVAKRMASNAALSAITNGVWNSLSAEEREELKTIASKVPMLSPEHPQSLASLSDSDLDILEVFLRKIKEARDESN